MLRQLSYADLAHVANLLSPHVQDLGKELKSNAKDTAEGTENAYRDANPEEGEKTPKETYRSTELKNSDNKYTPKSDPKK